ncbi:MAG: hypothetical protein HN736_06855 [Anaerolineae bacterium]|jgi:hypothetical protein|nr:hypothetical protein [Anaerolineae bacterium]MBT7819491.1 hypothetical protein [Chloroflexota bacterium]MBT4312516.1 hypothetical protein [Anaerolineae bacterium]MBT4459615.1 hypothetical protein [Anaerolineae bacterium]MBT4841628.1 hypothetical protein [Anaerolineae bacterium]
MRKTWNQIQSFLVSRYMWWGIILLGIFLRSYLYFLNRSLWADEASLAINLVTRDFSELAQLLDYHQAAPVGFLFVEKFFITIFGNHDYVFRIFPLISGVLVIYFIYRFARTHLGPAGLFALAIASITWWFVYHSSEAKQYSSDIMVASLLIFLAGNCFKEEAKSKEFFLLGIVGSVVIWISHPSVFILAGIGITLAFEKITQKEYVPWAWILSIGLGWLFSFGIEYLVSLRHIVADGYLIEYWRKAYVPSPPWSNKAWYGRTFLYFLDYTYHKPDQIMTWATLILIPIGALSALIRNRKIAFLLISPFVIVYMASALHLYPLKDRFLLFLIPFIILLTAEGFRGIYWVFSKWNRDFAIVLTGMLAFFIVWQIVPITYERVFSGRTVNIRPVIEYVAEKKHPDDIVYVFYRSNSVVSYYAPLYGIDEENIIIGIDGPFKQDAHQGFRDDVDVLAGEERVWFIFSEVADCPNCEDEDTQSYYLSFINKYGTLIDSVGGAASNGANAYLYDMTP